MGHPFCLSMYRDRIVIILCHLQLTVTAIDLFADVSTPSGRLVATQVYTPL